MFRNISVIGLGKLGYPMAQFLSSSGAKINCFDKNKELVQELKKNYGEHLHEIGLNNLKIRIQPGIKVENEINWRQALTRNMLKSKLWSINENSVTLNKDSLFRSYLKLPSNVITGQFEVKILHYRNSKLVSQQINSINVSKSGISAEIYDIAQNYSTLYGIFAVLLAVLVGWGCNLIFRKV